MSPKKTENRQSAPANSPRHVALSEFLLGDLTDVEAGLNWFCRLQNCKTALAANLQQVLDSSDLSEPCQRTALEDLRASVNELNSLLVEGLNSSLGCFSPLVRQRLDPYLAGLLHVTNEILARYSTRQDPGIDSLSAAFRALIRECQPLVKTLQIAKSSRLQQPLVTVGNDSRDAWLYKAFHEIGPDGSLIAYKNITLAFREECDRQGWSYVDDISSMKRAATRWADRHGRSSIPKRQSGRPSKPR